LNSFPVQNASTGVVFGRLTAIQKIKNENGQNIRIPLVNVPIGIFNPSEEFPSIFSTDNNGDRLTLNIKEASNPSQYFNSYSYFSDYNEYLKSADSFSAVPAQYQYVTITNENGEFVLYDIPIGQQTAIFEVDLFKQGLTKDEIALNFFPFPGTEGANVDSIPSFVYKQFPIDVVPAWGVSQTGYTSLDININLDLRKWATFYTSPMSYNGYKLGSPELSSVLPYASVDVKDMSRANFPTTNISLVEIEDISNKDKTQSLLWENEFSTVSSTARFYSHGFKAFKVRANMYDPNGYKTDSDGIPMMSSYSKGVWLSGYQFKFYYNSPNDIFKSTGFQRDWGKPNPKGWVGRDHFHLNRNIQSDTKNTNTPPNFSFPYEKPWSASYPEPYKIPRRPTQFNFDRFDNSSRLKDSNGKFFLEQPLYKDGDLVGRRIDKKINNENVGGYGAQYQFSSSYYGKNRFSEEVTSLYMYKYESGVSWGEKYSNGYEPGNSNYPIQPEISKVNNGEKYQRVECGYGYWLRPEGLPPVTYKRYGDLIFQAALKVGDTLASGTYGPGVLDVGQFFEDTIVKAQNQYIDIYNIDEKDICIALDSFATFSEGGLDIYRIVNPNDLAAPGVSIIPTFVKYNFQQFYFQRAINQFDRLASSVNNKNDNDNDEMFAEVGQNIQADLNYSFLRIRIQNDGIIPIDIPNSNDVLLPGEGKLFDVQDLNLNNSSITLPGNSDLNLNNGKYETAKYSMQFENIVFENTNESPYGRFIKDVNQPASENTPEYYLVSDAGVLRTQYDNKNEQCQTKTSASFDNQVGGSGSRWENNVTMNGALFHIEHEKVKGKVNKIRFQSSEITSICGSEDYKDGTRSIPIQLK
jgi:hypothetical protein